MAGKSNRRDGEKLVETEDLLQAVIIADSFNIRYAPLTSDKPRVLLPLVNRPLIDYTLECLKASRVQEVILFCSTYGDQIKEYIRLSPWSSASSPMQVTVVLSDSCSTVGDALREIDAKALVRGDFILVFGDVVANVKLLPIMLQHKERKKVDRGCVMTLLYKESAPGHGTQTPEDELVVAFEPETNKIFHLHRVGHQKKFDVPLTVFQENARVSIRHDLLDCQIVICSPQVLMLFAENFDYQTLDDLARGILVNDYAEILGNTIYLHVLTREYAARASNLYMYGAISYDVLNRWVYPVTPDLARGAKFSHLRRNVYLPKDVTLARGCKLEENTIIGCHSQVDTRTRISNSVIGEHCKIGKNVVIENSYLWNNITVEDGSTLKYAIVADNVTVKSGVTVSPGCVLSYNVVVGPDKVIPEGKLLTADQEEASESGDFGKESRAFVNLSVSEPDESDEEELVQELWKMAIQSEDSDDASSDDVDQSGDELYDSPIPDDVNLFYKEVLDSLVRGAEEKVKSENLVLEINASRSAYNVTVKEVIVKLTMAILALPAACSDEELTTQQLATQTLQMLTDFRPLLGNYVKNIESALNCLSAIEEYCFNHPNTTLFFVKILSKLYDQDILTEDSILRWHKQPNDENIEEHTSLRKKAQPLITWLQEAQEESSSEDS